MSDCQRARSEVFVVVPLQRRYGSVDPLAFSGGKRGRSKALFFAVLNGTSIADPELVRYFMRPRELGLRQATSEATAKDIIFAHVSVPARAAIVPLLDRLPAWAHDFCNPEDPDALGDDSSFFATQQQSGVLVFAACCVATWPAYCHPHWIPAQLQERSKWRKTKVVTSLSETGKIRDGVDCNARHQRLFSLVRGSSFTCSKTNDRTSQR